MLFRSSLDDSSPSGDLEGVAPPRPDQRIKRTKRGFIPVLVSVFLVGAVLFLLMDKKGLSPFPESSRTEELLKTSEKAEPESEPSRSVSRESNPASTEKLTEELLNTAGKAGPEKVRQLIQAGADVNAKKEDGWTPLMLTASDNPNLEVLKVLLKAGADVNAQNKYGRTPLIEIGRASCRERV